jgi:hypothetical protein
MLEPFIWMVRMLFHDASTTVSLNGECIDSFEIRRDLRQGCPLVPYFFLLVGEALHAATRAAIQAGDHLGILLPDRLTQQTLSPYADDTTYSLAGMESNIHTITNLLSCFQIAAGLVYNPQKSVTYWIGHGAPPPWLQVFECQVAVENQLSVRDFSCYGTY